MGRGMKGWEEEGRDGERNEGMGRGMKEWGEE